MSECLSFETQSVIETEALGERLARAILSEPRPQGSVVILLSGELGAGKTSFVRGMLRGLHAPPEVRVTSPTYVLQHIYTGGRATLYHIDAYRIGGGSGEFAASGLLEGLDDPAGIVCIEWPENLGDLKWPEDLITIKFEHRGQPIRGITLHGVGIRSDAALRAMA
jgi:tRNA threonylcarbamoyladenosine biosynthesis protein TsaE